LNKRVLHFEIVAELGRGGMGVVYKAWDTRLERHVALKFLSAGADSKALRPLIDEAIAASRLPVPSVVTIHAEYDSPEGPFLCMEHAPGGCLGRRLARGPLPLEQALRVGLDVARALQAAHRAEILHCDLKPGNVLLYPDGSAKVTDFGLSRRVDRAAPAAPATNGAAPGWPVAVESLRPSQVSTRPASPSRRALGGTPGYMSPEQMRGGPLDARSDLFALGILLLEMATGRNPFLEQLRRSEPLRFEPPPVRNARRGRPEFPAAYWRLAGRLLREDPADRPREAASAVRSLERLRVTAKATDAAAGDEPRLFGRDEQREELRAALAGLIECHGSAWLIEGGPGAGKTALADLFRHDARSCGVTVLRGCCAPDVAPLPYRPYLDALRDLVDAQASGATAETFLRHEVGLAPEVAGLLGATLAFPDSAAKRLTGRSQLRDALRTAVQALARDRALALVIEDLHEAGPASRDLWTSWSGAAPDMPLLLIGTLDPEPPLPVSDARAARQPPRPTARAIADRGTARTLTLPPLDRDETERLLRSLLPVLPAGHRGIDQVFWRTRGVPAFVVEIADLARRAGNSVEAVGQVLEGVIPDSMRTSLALRLQSLEREELRLLRAAAVVGERFAPALLVEAGVVDATGFAGRLHSLEFDHRLIRRENDDHYRFQQPQMSGFLVASLAPGARTELHGAIADLLVRRSDVPAGILARHLVAAGRDNEAAPFMRAAAESALSVFADEEALRLADLAARSLPPGKSGHQRRRDILLIRARALESLGRVAEARTQAQLAVRLARQAKASGPLGEALVVLGAVERQLERTAQAERTLREAERCCTRGRKPRGRVQALLNRGHLRYQRGRYRAAAAMYGRALQAATRCRDPALAASGRANQANVLAAQGDFERAAEGYGEALEFHRERGDSRNAALLEGNLGLVRLKQGRFDEARSLLDSSLRTRHEIGDRRGAAMAELRLARCALLLGRPRLALVHARHAREVASSTGGTRVVHEADLGLAECTLGAGSISRAIRQLERLADRVESLANIVTVRTFDLLARAYLARGETAAAAASVRRAKSIVSRLNDPAQARSITPTQARVLLARRRFAQALAVLGVDPRAARRWRSVAAEDVEDGIMRALLVHGAARARSRRVQDASDRLAALAEARAEKTIERVAAGVADALDRRSYLGRWRREKKKIDALV